MKMRKTDLPAAIRQNGIAFNGVDWGEMNVSNIHLPAGADAAPLLEGLEQDHCQCPHWGMVLKGSIRVDYQDGASETVHAGEVYHWPAGHTVSTSEDYEAIEFSPADQMREVLNHLKRKLAA
jgi:hypothetical protein